MVNQTSLKFEPPEIWRIGRIWADGQAIEQAGLTLRLHHGTEDQLPDPLIEAIEGAGRAPAYRGTAYLVIEDLDLTTYGDRIPQFNFEVFRAPVDGLPGVPRPPALDIRSVALVPSTGEYALATEPVTFRRDSGYDKPLTISSIAAFHGIIEAASGTPNNTIHPTRAERIEARTSVQRSAARRLSSASSISISAGAICAV